MCSMAARGTVSSRFGSRSLCCVFADEERRVCWFVGTTIFEDGFVAFVTTLEVASVDGFDCPISVLLQKTMICPIGSFPKKFYLFSPSTQG